MTNEVKHSEGSDFGRLVGCPNCPDQGWYAVEGTTAGCCGYPTESGECCGNPVPVPTQEQMQCEFCWTYPDSVFNARKNEGN